MLDIDEIKWEEGYGGTDEEGEGKAAVFDRFRPVSGTDLPGSVRCSVSF